MGRTSAWTPVLDAGGLIALERGDENLRALLDLARRGGATVVVPAGVVAQVWRDGSRQVAMARLLRHRTTRVPPLDEATARAAGALCGRTASSDVIDASVVLAARAAAPAVVVTSDPHDIRQLDPLLHVMAL